MAYSTNNGLPSSVEMPEVQALPGLRRAESEDGIQVGIVQGQVVAGETELPSNSNPHELNRGCVLPRGRSLSGASPRPASFL